MVFREGDILNGVGGCMTGFLIMAMMGYGVVVPFICAFCSFWMIQGWLYLIRRP